VDYLAIADAVAGRYEGLTTPVGAQPIRSSTARLPNSPGAFPIVGVVLDDGELTYLSSRVDGMIKATVRLYYGGSTADLPRMLAPLYAWLGVMLAATHGAVKLGLAPAVTKAIPLGWDVGVFTWSGVEYIGLEIRLGIWTEETVTLVP